MSDWGATHTTSESIKSGIDQEMGNWEFKLENIANNQTAIDTPVFRILKQFFEKGIWDYPFSGNWTSNVTTIENLNLA